MFTYSIGYWEAYRRFQGGFVLVVRGGYVGGSFQGGIYYGEGNFHEGDTGRDIAMKGRQISQHYKKNDQKLNKKQVFSTESKEQH